MFCGKCGSKLNYGEKFCGKCGNAVLEEQVQYTNVMTTPLVQPAVKNNNIKNKKSLVVVLCSIALALSVVLGVVFIPDWDTNIPVDNNTSFEEQVDDSYISADNETDFSDDEEFVSNEDLTNISEASNEVQIDESTTKKTTSKETTTKNNSPSNNKKPNSNSDNSYINGDGGIVYEDSNTVWYEIPNVNDMTVTEAKKNLSEFNVEIEYMYSDIYQENTVIWHSPEIYTEVPKGTKPTIVLTVSAGPAEDAWSEWSTEKPSGDNLYIEEEYYYRERTIKRANIEVFNQDAIVGPWSEWVPGSRYPDGKVWFDGSNKGYEVENQTFYRWRKDYHDYGSNKR